MSAETIPRQNTEELAGERERIPVLSYEEYRIFCDDAQSDVYRKTGIDSQENYEAAIGDPTTVYVEKNELRLPLFVGLEHAGGYNVERTRHLTGREQVFAMALPTNLFESEELKEYLDELGKDAAVVVQTYANETQDAKSSLNDIEGWHAGEFLDPRCRAEKDQPAWISLYTAHLQALDSKGDLIPFQDRPLQELYEEDVRETGKLDTELVTAQRLRDDEQLLEQLWALHDDRFDWLGEYHPVSMQETEDFFRYVVTNDHTTSFVRFDDDENGERVPVCHGCFIDDLELVEWLDDRMKQKITQQAEADGEVVQFFYGITGKSTARHYAEDIIRLHARVDQRNGGKVQIVFESTGLSSGYIPRMVQGYTAIEPNGIKLSKAIESTAQLDYWYLASESSETV